MTPAPGFPFKPMDRGADMAAFGHLAVAKSRSLLGEMSREVGCHCVECGAHNSLFVRQFNGP